MTSIFRKRNVNSNQIAPPKQNPGVDKHDNYSGTFEIVTPSHDVAKPKKHKSTKRRNGFIFALGGLFGIIIAGFFANHNDLIDLPELGELSMDSLLDVLPASLIKEVRDLTRSERDTVNYDSFSVGLKLVSQGVRANHSVVMIPGVISTGLESWGTSNNSRQYFRKRLWGSWSMMRALVLDKEGWKKHIMLNKKTGLDPEDGIKLRAAQGFDATDFFITGYWIWNKILENLATIGYDPTNSYTAAYDWRLSYANLEIRDQYFTRLKKYIEMSKQMSNKKLVLISHSMGSQVIFYFFHWVASPRGGNGGENWVENHIDSWINISGCMLGAIKGLSSVLSGEMKDTAQLNSFAVYGLEKFLSKGERAEIFRTMPGVSSMLPMGGNAVWGNATWAPDDPEQNLQYGQSLKFKQAEYRNLTVEESLAYLMNITEDWYQDHVRKSYSHGVAHTTTEVEKNENDPRKWVNPLETRLPIAPNLKIYCFYGIGKPTERAYFYRNSGTSPLDIGIDTTLTNGNIDHGVILGEGDGTVNLLSVGYMCHKGWNIHRYNPSKIKIKVFEMPHEPHRFNPRGGPNTADHVDILGRQSLNDMILRISAGKGDEIQDHVISNIIQYSNHVKIKEEDGF